MTKSIHSIIKGDKGLKDRESLSTYMYDAENDEVKFLTTNSITLNLLFSGKCNGGIPIGHMSMISAPSQLGKSLISMNIVRAAQKAGMQVVYIDTERAFKKSMAEGIKVDVSPEKLQVLRDSRVDIIESIIVTICDAIPVEERKNVLFVLDSWGTLVTSKSLKDGLTGNDVADMTEPKKKNRLANLILNTQATFFIVNHVYDNTGGFGDPLVIPGGKRVAFNCESIVLGMSRAKDRSVTAGEDLDGHIITAKTFKSRFSKVESKLQYRIRLNGGLDPFYGLLDEAIEHGCVVKPKAGKYSRTFIEGDKEFKEKDVYSASFWGPIFKETDFAEWVEAKFQFSDENLVSEDEELLDSIFS